MDLKKSSILSYNNKNVVITGVNRGLGKGLFTLFTWQGYNVYGIVRSKPEAERLRNEIPPNAKIVLADLSSDECIATIKSSIGKERIDLLINNAGIAGQSDTLDNSESDEILNLFNIHCLGVFRTMKSLKENLLHAEHPIVLNLNSRLGSITRQSNGRYENVPVSYSYRIAKAAQNMLTNCLRKEFKTKVRFLSIHPGKMHTDIAQIDADVDPGVVANKILEFYENEKFQEENGIIELGKELIEW